MKDSAAYKNSIRQKTSTRLELNWYEEKDGSTVRVDASTVWLDAAYIPDDPNDLTLKDSIYYAQVGSSYVPIVEKFKATLHKENAAGTVFSSPKLTDALWTSKYHLILTDVNGDEIPFGLKGWDIDTINGYLTFTKGKPGYEGPFHVSGYRYAGRKMSDAVLTSDGHSKMDSEYAPKEPNDIVTKEYVDKLVDSVSVNVEKMRPPRPETFEGKPIELICGKMIEATDIVTMTEYENVVLPDYMWTVRSPVFYNPGAGKVSLLVFANGTWLELASYDLEKKIASGLAVEYDEDAYADTLSSKGFYRVLQLSYTNCFKNISGILKSHTAPVKFKFRYSYRSDIFFTDEAVLCEELEQATDTLSGEEAVITPDKLKYTYISGVVTPTKDSSFLVTGLDYTSLRKFIVRKTEDGEARFPDVNSFEMTSDDGKISVKSYQGPKLPYDKYSPREEITRKLSIPDGFYSEHLNFKACTYNIFGDVNGAYESSYNYRIDAVSDESNRVTSGEEINGQIIGACKKFDSSASIADTNELQLLGGVWQWPEKDFSINGTGKIVSGIWNDVSWVRGSVDYSKASKEGERFFTLVFDAADCNSVTLEMSGENLSQDPDTFEYNVSSLLIKADDVTDWLDAKKAYDGTGPCKDWKDGCLVPSKSKEGSIYCTFGPLMAKGKVYVRVGMWFAQHIKIDRLRLAAN